MCRTANSIGLSFNGFLFIFQIILFSIWFYTTRKYFTDIHFVFLVFIPFMGIYNFGIIITESEESTTGIDANADGKIRWLVTPADSVNNIDYANIKIITDTCFP